MTYANDLDEDLATITVGLDLTPNAIPLAMDDAGSVLSHASVLSSVLAKDTDADGNQQLALALLPTGPRHGSATIGGGAIRHAPDPGDVGRDSLVYAIRDGAGGLAAAELGIGITPPGDRGGPKVGRQPAPGGSPPWHRHGRGIGPACFGTGSGAGRFAAPPPPPPPVDGAGRGA